MSDLIDRQAAIVQLSHNKTGDDDCDVVVQNDIETIKVLPSAQPETDGFCDGCKEYDQDRHFCPRFDRVIKTTVEEMKAEPQWIPVDLRNNSPEENKVVLLGVLFRDNFKYFVTSRQDYNYWTGLGREIKGELRWQPLPEPYAERRTDDLGGISK